MCASGYESSSKRFRSIVESVVVAGTFCQRAFERLEPCAVKVARTVLRRGSGSNITLLSDFDIAVSSTIGRISFRLILRRSYNKGRAANLIDARNIKIRRRTTLDKFSHNVINTRTETGVRVAAIFND